MTAPTLTLETARAALREVETTAEDLGMYSTGSDGGERLMPVGARRRRRRAGLTDPVATASLVRDDDGLLHWVEGAPSTTNAGLRRRRGRAPESDGELVELYQYEKLEPNQITQFLTGLDGRLNTNHGLRRLILNGAAGSTTIGASAAVHVPTGKKRRLVFVHGIFSKCDAFVAGMERAPNRDTFWKRVFAHYDEVLAFEHPTLSVSPVLNAFDLQRAFAKATGPLDVVAHSRGGVVTRWFLEGFGGSGGGPHRAVLVGSPLGGTSLAAPPRLKSSLSALSNFGTALRAAGAPAVAYFPFLAAPLALMRVATSVASVAAKTPIIDAAVAMIPGMAGLSRVALNHELARSHGFSPSPPPTYSVVQCDFESEAAGWRFWKWFRADKIADSAVDRIFPRANDLVVDTGSMNQFLPNVEGSPLPAGVPAKRVLDFGTGSTVHHTNYFGQPQTLDFILAQLGVP